MATVISLNPGKSVQQLGDSNSSRKISSNYGLLPEDSVQLGNSSVMTSYSSLVSKVPVKTETVAAEISSSEPSCSGSVFVDRDASQPTSLEVSGNNIGTLVESITKEL